MSCQDKSIYKKEIQSNPRQFAELLADIKEVSTDLGAQSLERISFNC